MGSGRLPGRAHSDAAHVAIAATNSLAVLLTWNCKHLANPSIHRKIVRACEVEGLAVLRFARPINRWEPTSMRNPILSQLRRVRLRRSRERAKNPGRAVAESYELREKICDVVVSETGERRYIASETKMLDRPAEWSR